MANPALDECTFPQRNEQKVSAGLSSAFPTLKICAEIYEGLKYHFAFFDTYV